MTLHDLQSFGMRSRLHPVCATCSPSDDWSHFGINFRQMQNSFTIPDTVLIGVGNLDKINTDLVRTIWDNGLTSRMDYHILHVSICYYVQPASEMSSLLFRSVFQVGCVTCNGFLRFLFSLGVLQFLLEAGCLSLYQFTNNETLVCNSIP